MRWHIRYIRSAILFFCAVLYLCPVSARAAPTLSLTVTCWVEGVPRDHQLFDLYHVGTLGDDGSVTYSESFGNGSFTDTLKDNSDYVTLARKLSDYVSDHSISADLSSVTDASGDAVFELPQNGLYLILGHAYEESSEDGVSVVTFEPILVSLTEDTVVETKHSVETPSAPKEPSTPVEPGEPDDPEPSRPTGSLPQTGILRWPILVLSFLAFLFLAGFLFSLRSSRCSLKCCYLLLLIFMASSFGAAGLGCRNHLADLKTGDGIARILSHLEDMPIDMRIPDNGDSELEAVRVYEGDAFLGVLEIPELELTLPVNQTWNYPALEVSPCRYSGSSDKSGFVICAHNYWSHFGEIQSLTKGSSVIFTDVMGAETQYEVVMTEILKPSEVSAMTSTDYDLTLFTCTFGGGSRVTVRCQRVNPDLGVTK